MAKLKEVMAEQSEKKAAGITIEQANVLCQLSMSQIEHSEKARKALVVFLEDVLAKSDISDEEARATASILKTITVSGHRVLCNQILNKYLGKFSDAVARFDAAREAAEAFRAEEARRENEAAMERQKQAKAVA